jgi:hypothetical protein
LRSAVAAAHERGDLPSVNPDLNCRVLNAYGINDRGQIAAMAYVNGMPQAVRLTPSLDGDANLDGTVNIADLSKVLTNYDQTGKLWADGDFNGDGAVDISDLSNVLTNYDKSLGAAAGIKAVPEPCALAMLAASLLGLLAYGRRKQS